VDLLGALELIRLGEGQRTEFKTSFSEEKEAIESLGAFANTQGGTVLFGIKPDGIVCGVDVGANTLENFANRLRRESQPPLSPQIDSIKVDGRVAVAVSVDRPALGQLFHVFNTARVRVGRTNQVMSPEEQRSRLFQGQGKPSEDRDRPRFEVTMQGGRMLEQEFSPRFKVRQFSGDPMANLEWCIRGRRFRMEWQQAHGGALDRTNFGGTFNLADSPVSEDHLGTDEMSFEIRFHWRGSWRTEVHRWPISRRALPQKVLWDVAQEVLPVHEGTEPEYAGVMFVEMPPPGSFW
jgi:hypothetical protein